MNLSRLYDADTTSVLVGVGVLRNERHPYNTHTGIVYRTDGGLLQFIHQAWHLKIRDEPWSHRVFCVPNIPIERARFLPRLCLAIARSVNAGKQVPYALRYPTNPVWNMDLGEIIANDNGLNCSNFVLMIFSQFGFSLIDMDGWPLRSEDAEWHRYLVDRMKETDHQQAAKIEVEIGSLRVRPEEVAGACLYDDIPVIYEMARKGSLRVIEAIDSSSPGVLE
jgi:hypothetical protein